MVFKSVIDNTFYRFCVGSINYLFILFLFFFTMIEKAEPTSEVFANLYHQYLTELKDSSSYKRIIRFREIYKSILEEWKESDDRFDDFDNAAKNIVYPLLGKCRSLLCDMKQYSDECNISTEFKHLFVNTLSLYDTINSSKYNSVSYA